MFKTWVLPGNGGPGGAWRVSGGGRTKTRENVRQFPTLCAVIISPIKVSLGGLLAFRQEEVNTPISDRLTGAALASCLD